MWYEDCTTTLCVQVSWQEMFPEVGSLPPLPNLNLEDQGLHLSGAYHFTHLAWMVLLGACAPASIAIRVIGGRRSPLRDNGGSSRRGVWRYVINISTSYVWNIVLKSAVTNMTRARNFNGEGTPCWCVCFRLVSVTNVYSCTHCNDYDYSKIQWNDFLLLPIRVRHRIL
jgi:hypothetical protein